MSLHPITRTPYVPGVEELALQTFERTLGERSSLFLTKADIRELVREWHDVKEALGYPVAVEDRGCCQPHANKFKGLASVATLDAQGKLKISYSRQSAERVYYLPVDLDKDNSLDEVTVQSLEFLGYSKKAGRWAR